MQAIYQMLIKPWWAPAAETFGPVLTVLYVLIAISFGTVFYRIYKKKLPKELLWPFALNLFFNFAYTPIQFGLKNNILALADVALVLGTLIWIFTLRTQLQKKNLGWVIWLNIPYFVWVSFATILQLSITYLNL